MKTNQKFCLISLLSIIILTLVFVGLIFAKNQVKVTKGPLGDKGGPKNWQVIIVDKIAGESISMSS
ncbi:MAG: hypothetical protein OEW23_16095 [Candidatus Aminicenantes bacterium]|nr:hypothetical protein [Candidatus Aminicenantes bacterium]